MRQLLTATFLFVFVIIGVYWLVTQRLHLNYFYPAPTVEFPNLVQPRPLSSITPGPGEPKLAGFANTPLPHVPIPGNSLAKSVPRAKYTYHPLPVTAPTALLVTPMPAPTYQVVTPMPLVHTPPPIVAPTFAPIGGASPSPSPTRSGESPPP